MVEEIDAGLWNSLAGQRFSWLMVYLRREFGPVQYVRATETQKRGVLHFHLLVRCAADLSAGVSSLVAHATTWHFGAQVDVQSVAAGGEDAERKAWYMAKYASKASSQRELTPWVDRRTGELDQAARYRAWSASAKWGTTMAALRASQCEWARVAASGPPGPGDGDLAGGTPALDSYPGCYTQPARSGGHDVIAGLAALLV